MPSLSEVKTFRKQIYDQSMALIDKKGADYNRDQQIQGDTLFNLRVCELLGIVPDAESGILVRLSDKFMRLISLTKPGREAAVKDESVLDTIKDIHNYVDYLGLIWLNRRMEKQQTQAYVGKAANLRGFDNRASDGSLADLPDQTANYASTGGAENK